MLRNRLNNSIKDFSIIPENRSDSELSYEEIYVGMEVLFKPLNSIGKILTLPTKSKNVQIQVGSTKLNTNITNLEKKTIVNHKTIPNINNNFSIKKDLNLKAKTISSEINVIGMNVEEAIFVIDKYLDDCSIASISPVKIVHGRGTGKLRAGIHTFLKNNKHVKSFRIGTFGEGEMGVTVVEIL